MAMNKILIGKEFYSVSRCGIIPYYKINENEYMFLLKVDEYGGYRDFGNGINSNETYLNGLYREVFTNAKQPRIFTRQNWDNSDESVTRIVRKIRSTHNNVQLEWLVPIELEYGNTRIQKSKGKLEWVNLSRTNQFTIQNMDGSLKNMMPSIVRKL